METKTCKYCHKDFQPINERKSHPAIFCGRLCCAKSRNLSSRNTDKTRIPLTQGKFAIIDAEDFDRVSRFTWHLLNKDTPTQYAITNVPIDGKMTTMRMHRLIMGDSLGVDYDHKDGDGLNNRKYNLRECTATQNRMNSRPRRFGTSQYKGVCWNTQKNKWQAKIVINGKPTYLGFFDNEINAATAYDFAAVKYFGEFARPNLRSLPAQAVAIAG